MDQRMPSNLLHSLVEYTTLPVDTEEHIVPLSDDKVYHSPFSYMAGHRLVQFTKAEEENFKNYIDRGGFVFADDCNHDIDGLFAKSFEAQMIDLFGEGSLKKIPNDHPLYSSFFEFDGPPTTSQELNGWGDDLVHDYLKAVEINGRIGCCILTKTMAVSGTMISEINDGIRMTIQDSGSISSSMP